MQDLPANFQKFARGKAPEAPSSRHSPEPAPTLDGCATGSVLFFLLPPHVSRVRELKWLLALRPRKGGRKEILPLPPPLAPPFSAQPMQTCFRRPCQPTPTSYHSHLFNSYMHHMRKTNFCTLSKESIRTFWCGSHNCDACILQQWSNVGKIHLQKSLLASVLIEGFVDYSNLFRRYVNRNP